eukprot:TRINITY_DN6028_c0_g1_i1.p1 TRINITY_DN6028_c0_g1~~TRINITY_DN6028_c0_g1_i1.p1  ORF type:complete len:187 (-),score=8.46 TRINITY_DN6028_c0_g1_i1:341-901(-)
MCQKRTLLSLTNFTSDELIAFSRQAEPFFTANCKRGKKPALSCLDHICLYLMYFKSGITMEGTASYLGLAENKVDKAIQRIREALFPLALKHLSELPRPVVMRDKPYPTVALLIDSTTIEVYRPRGRFEEAKIYFDSKNKIYGLKKEVAVTATAPHLAVFSFLTLRKQHRKKPPSQNAERNTRVSS